MPGTPTPKYAIPTLVGTDLVKGGPAAINASLAAIDQLLAPSDQGLFASRPVSTGGSPGKIGRTYKSTDGLGGESVARMFRDHGTGWDEIPFAAQQAWQTLTCTNGLVLSYMKDTLGFVHLRGDLWVFTSFTAIGTALGTFPVGYRPGTTIVGTASRVYVTGNGSTPEFAAAVSVGPTGVLTWASGNSALAPTPPVSGYVASLLPWRAES